MRRSPGTAGQTTTTTSRPTSSITTRPSTNQIRFHEGVTVYRDKLQARLRLQPWTNYTFHVRARNRLGLSERSNFSKVECKTPPTKPHRNPAKVCTESRESDQLVITWEVCFVQFSFLMRVIKRFPKSWILYFSDIFWSNSERHRLSLWPSGIGMHLGRNRVPVRFLAVSNIILYIISHVHRAYSWKRIVIIQIEI